MSQHDDASVSGPVGRNAVTDGCVIVQRVRKISVIPVVSRLRYPAALPIKPQLLPCCRDARHISRQHLQDWRTRPEPRTNPCRRARERLVGQGGEERGLRYELIRKDPASRGTEKSADVLIGPPGEGKKLKDRERACFIPPKFMLHVCRERPRGGTRCAHCACCCCSAAR